MEVLKQIEGHPDYWVAPDGRIYSRKFGELRPLRPIRDIRGYPRVTLRTNGKYSHVAVSQIVATAFLPPPPIKRARVIHLDGDPQNNRADNLAWYNAKRNARGKGYRKLSNEHVADIRRRLKAGELGAKLAEEYGVSPSMVSRILHGNRREGVSAE